MDSVRSAPAWLKLIVCRPAQRPQKHGWHDFRPTFQPHLAGRFSIAMGVFGTF
jgi:hypothetical protein